MSTVNNGPQIVRSGLILDLDASYMRSYSPNVYPNPTDLLATQYMGNEIQSCTVSRDTTITRQYGSIPMKMVITGNDAYAGRYGYLAANLASALSGQTWTISVWAKASVATDGQLFIFGADTNGAWSVTPDYSAGTIAITTSWQRFSFSYTFTNASTRYIQFRLDGTNVGGSGITIWWDGLQIERASAATNFNPYYFGNAAWKDVSGSGYNGTINTATFLSPNPSSIVFSTVSSDFVSLGNVLADLVNLTLECFVKFSTQTASYGGVISKTLSNADGWEIRVGAYTSTTTGLQFRYVGDTASIGFNTTFNNGTWYHIVATGTNGSQKTYVNGVQDNSGSYTLTPSANSNSLLLGRLAYSGLYVNMNMNSARIYNRALTATEVMQNYQATKTRFGL
jgi:hypothetical protein